MSRNVAINVHHLTRVEGHGNIVVNVKDGKIEKMEWQVPEAPRFFEAIIRRRHYTEVARITSRICGICAIGHTLASVKATENALGIAVTPQTAKLRTVIKHAENFDSHVLHIYFLVAPDLFKAPSVFPLVPTHTEVVVRALRMKRFAHEWGALLAGRTTHPTRIVPGGFAEYASEADLKNLKKRLIDLQPDLDATVQTILSVADNIPPFERPTEYMALSSDKEYAVYDGAIQTVMPEGTKQRWPVAEYRSCTNEYVVPQSTAKYAKNKMASYMAGALARFNNNYDLLHPEAKKVAEALKLEPLCFNPYMNSAAQLVEVVHSVKDSVRLLDEVLGAGYKPEDPVKPKKFGRGQGSVEVPRGILFHEYEYDKDGMCTGGNCIIPTNQNHGNIQQDFETLVPKLLAEKKDEKAIELGLEMLVRAYDPCISCSTHYLKVDFKR